MRPVNAVKQSSGNFSPNHFKTFATVSGHSLSDKYFIRIPRRVADANGEMKISVNETWLYRDAKYIVDAFKEGLKAMG